MGNINFELLAVKLGDAIKYTRSVSEIERIARATLRVNKRHFENDHIKSIRAQTVFDWIKSIELASLTQEEKIRRCVSFIEALELDEEDKKKMYKLLGKDIIETIPLDDLVQNLRKLPIEQLLIENLEKRLFEVEKCIENKAFLAAITLMGSILEGLLLAIVALKPKEANLSKSAPKNKDGKVKKFHEWTLTDLISVAHACKWIDADVKDFSDQLRDYRNMIHPYHQIRKGIYPDFDTVKICWEVLKAAINDLTYTCTNNT